MTWAVRKICSKNVWPRYLSYWHIGRHLDRVNSSNQSWEQRRLLPLLHGLSCRGCIILYPFRHEFFIIKYPLIRSVELALERSMHGSQSHTNTIMPRTQRSIAAPMCRPRPFCFAFFFPPLSPFTPWYGTVVLKPNRVNTSLALIVVFFSISPSNGHAVDDCHLHQARSNSPPPPLSQTGFGLG